MASSSTELRKRAESNLLLCMRMPQLRDLPHVPLSTLVSMFRSLKLSLPYAELNYSTPEEFIASVHGLEVSRVNNEPYVQYAPPGTKRAESATPAVDDFKAQVQQHEQKMRQEKVERIQAQKQRDLEQKAAVEDIVALVRIASDDLGHPLSPENLAQSFLIRYRRPLPLDLFDCQTAGDLVRRLILSRRLAFDSNQLLRVAVQPTVVPQTEQSSITSGTGDTLCTAQLVPLDLPRTVHNRLIKLAYKQAGLPVRSVPEAYKQAYGQALPSFGELGCRDLLELLRRTVGLTVMQNPLEAKTSYSLYCNRLPAPAGITAPPLPDDCVPPGYRLPVQRLRLAPPDAQEQHQQQVLQQVLIPRASNGGPSLFYVIPYGEESHRLDQLISRLDEAQHQPLPPAYARPHQLCVAVTDQGCVRRVRILDSVGEDRRLVEDVDYGERLSVSLDSLRCLSRQFVDKLPAHAVPCRHAFVYPPDGAALFDSRAVQIFQRLSADQLVELFVHSAPDDLNYPNEPYSVLISVNGVSFLNTLYERRLISLPIERIFLHQSRTLCARQGIEDEQLFPRPNMDCEHRSLIDMVVKKAAPTDDSAVGVALTNSSDAFSDAVEASSDLEHVADEQALSEKSTMQRYEQKEHKNVDSHNSSNYYQTCESAEEPKYGAVDQQCGAEEQQYEAEDQQYGAEDQQYGAEGAEDQQYGAEGAEGAEDHQYGTEGAEDHQYGAEGAEDHQYGAEGAEDHQYGAEDQQYGAEDHQYRPEDHQYGAEDHQYGAEDQQNAAEDLNYEAGGEAKQYGAEDPQHGAMNQVVSICPSVLNPHATPFFTPMPASQGRPQLGQPLSVFRRQLRPATAAAMPPGLFESPTLNFASGAPIVPASVAAFSSVSSSFQNWPSPYTIVQARFDYTTTQDPQNMAPPVMGRIPFNSNYSSAGYRMLPTPLMQFPQQQQPAPSLFASQAQFNFFPSRPPMWPFSLRPPPP